MRSATPKLVGGLDTEGFQLGAWGSEMCTMNERRGLSWKPCHQGGGLEPDCLGPFCRHFGPGLFSTCVTLGRSLTL